MQRVLVVSPEKIPLSPCRPARARWLLTQKRAAILRRYPFTIILKQPPSEYVTPPLRVKIDPGSQTTGIVMVNDATGEVIWAAELAHRGRQVKEALDTRQAQRRGRRHRHTRYRQPRFDNRRRPEGWLPPSLLSRIQNVVTWVERLRRYAPITNISYELVRFDTQLIERPDISGIEYQQGTLAGWEAREYLLLKWGYRCAYCGVQAIRWEVDHITPRSRGGSNRISNLALSCHNCNQEKGDCTAAEYGHPDVQIEAKKPLKDAAAVNSTRWALYERLQQTRLPVETGTGGRTKWNRTNRAIPKTHWLDASCIGQSTPEHLHWRHVCPLLIQAAGRHSRQMRKVNKHGFPIGSPKGTSTVLGWHTGDMVRAVVTKGKPAGTYVGRVAVKKDGYFKITGGFGVIEGVHARYCTPIHRNDGYGYTFRKEAALPPHA
ncbi:MAG: HNH endonuclease [Ktedonobacterales bacterium]|nr:HNH endonuclease [Ktedonobacterales bacterium]